MEEPLHTQSDLNVCSKCGRALSAGASFCGYCGHATDDEWIGEVVDGRYRIEERIGEGGMGSVYRVKHVRMGKVAAMKVIHGLLAKNTEMRARFRREAEAISRLTHVNTVQVFDFGEYKGGLYLVMEYVRGLDLGSILRRDGPMESVRACRVILQVCEALAEAHEKGVIHRDIKPENLLLSRHRDGSDFVKVVDFGLARIRGDADPEITSQGSVLGTPYYMAPEQARGESPDGRTDIYAVGGVLYRCLTGEVPFSAPSPLVVLTKCLTEDLVEPAARRPDLRIPDRVNDIVVKAMAKEPKGRYEIVDEMADDLRRIVNEASGVIPMALPSASTVDKRWSESVEVTGEVVKLRREDFDQFERALRRRRMFQILVVPVILLAGLAVGGYFLWKSHVTHPQHPVTQEVEPNNTTKQANLIAKGTEVVGTIGKRLSATDPDVDAYRFQLPAGQWLLSASLWPQRNMDLSVSLYGGQGDDEDLIAVSQHSGDSGPEAIRSVVLGAGQYFVVVSQVVGKKGPLEGLSDQYRLKVDWKRRGPGDEVEPNDAMERAQLVDVRALDKRGKVEVSGFLSWIGDRDDFAFRLPDAGAVPAGRKPSKDAYRLISVSVSSGRADDLSVDCLAVVPEGVSSDKKLPHEALKELPLGLRKASALTVLSWGKKQCFVKLPFSVRVLYVAVYHTKRAESATCTSPVDMVEPYRLQMCADMPLDQWSAGSAAANGTRTAAAGTHSRPRSRPSFRSKGRSVRSKIRWARRVRPARSVKGRRAGRPGRVSASNPRKPRTSGTVRRSPRGRPGFSPRTRGM
ncbi:MAG: protein kinase [Deltaproteobacteria bacterium]|nr:protein kinase [Deltaproteobacteria bacterium]